MKKTLLIILLLTGMLSLSVLQAQELKVISFNIRNSGASKEDGKNAWMYRANAVIKMIEKEQPVAIGMQEALLDQLSTIDQRFRKKYRRVGIGRDNGLTRGEFMAIYYDFTRLELLAQRTRWLSDTPTRVSRGWDAACIRTVTIAKFRVRETGKEFYYFNTHLDHVGSEARKQSILLIRDFIEANGDKNTPVILGGDMNVTISSDIFDPLYDIGMTSARENAPLTDNRISFNGFGKQLPTIIDHFFTRNITVFQFKTITFGYGVRYLSDHYPIEIIFSL